jgi:hypothetical protein
MKKPFRTFLAFFLTLLPLANQAALRAIATRDIQLNGYDLFIDSFNSTDPLRSTGGQYDVLKGGGDASIVGSEAGVHNANNVANVQLFGQLKTSLPFVLEIGAQSSIGSAAWHQSGQTGIEPGFQTADFAFIYPDAQPPFGGVVPTSGTYNGVVYTYILASGAYDLTALTLSGGQNMLVTGSATLHVRGNVNLSGNGSIVVLPSANLQLFVGGKANLRGNGIVNLAAPQNFTYLGMGPSSTLDLRVTTPFVGLIYAPTSVCTISSSGNTSANLQGAIVARTIVLAAPVDFHFDEGL